MNRPSHKELFGKLRAARAAVEAERVALLNQTALAVDAIDLGYSIDLDLYSVLAEILDACNPADYTGSRPPQRSYEQTIEGLELYAFAAEIRRFKCRVYVKFAIEIEGDMLWLVSLHQDRPNPKEEP